MIVSLFCTCHFTILHLDTSLFCTNTSLFCTALLMRIIFITESYRIKVLGNSDRITTFAMRG